VAELKAGIALKAFVVRGGQEKEIEARDLCPGDIVRSDVRISIADPLIIS
jgi:magnesium-transporting ATPase (P-type)